MALNSYYPNYTNPYQVYQNPYLQQTPQMVQPMQTQQIASAQQQNAQPSINWVSGDREAAAYPVAPNNAVALWSQSEPVVYLKQADATGKPSMKIYDLVERTQTVQAPGDEKFYATKEELDRIKEEISNLRNELAKRKAAVRRREEDEE